MLARRMNCRAPRRRCDMLPIVELLIDGEPRKYYADERLGEYRSVDGSDPWVISAFEVDAPMVEVLATVRRRDISD